MTRIEKIKSIINLDVDDELLIAVVLEMERFLDKQFVEEIRKIQKDNGVVFDSPTRKTMRKKFYYGEYYNYETPFPIERASYLDSEIEEAFDDLFSRLETYDSNKIIQSIRQRIDDLQKSVISDENMAVWLSGYKKRHQNTECSFLLYYLDQEIFESKNFDENLITDFIWQSYDSLENYRHLAIVVKGELFNKEKECITWNMLYKAGIFAENFVQYKEDFFPFKKKKQILELTEFLKSRKVKNAERIASDFYSAISTGYKFEDCYISNNQDVKILVYKKIELDSTHIPCPSCNTIIQSGNSFPEMFLRSWECKNPSCPDRSKSGRGKRFDEYGTYRYFKLVENNPKNRISSEMYQNFRRDIFDEKNSWMDFLICDYSFEKEKLLTQNTKPKKLYGRRLSKLNVQKQINERQNTVFKYNDLPIVKMYKAVFDVIVFKTGSKKLIGGLEIINDDSSHYLQTLKTGQIGTAFTSPPYYNAREYSQWSTLLMYLVDMLINCAAVFNSLANGGYYLYNIGDIVSEDNVYVVSNMSKRRLQLGFLSCMIFETAGYNLTGNIIWDKGEVQSKRNSTVNLTSGYVKCVNCYEHVLVFRKGKYERLSNTVHQITPVIKINNKGENLYKHTAPFPVELVELVSPYVQKKLYVLDPFLGSGTTLKWCRLNGEKGVGVELSPEYFKLATEYIYQDEPEQQKLF